MPTKPPPMTPASTDKRMMVSNFFRKSFLRRTTLGMVDPSQTDKGAANIHYSRPPCPRQECSERQDWDLEWPYSMYVLYSTLLGAALFLSLPYWIYQMLRHGKYHTGLFQRLGRVPPHLSR